MIALALALMQAQPMVDDRVAVPDVRDGSAGCGDCRARTERFLVAYTDHYGYGFFTEEDRDRWIPVDFANENVGQEFDRYFSNENASSWIGKTIYCDCVGERHERDGRTFFRVVEARFFAR